MRSVDGPTIDAGVATEASSDSYKLSRQVHFEFVGISAFAGDRTINFGGMM